MKKILIALPALIAATAHTGTTNAHYLRVVERPDPHTIRFVGSDLIEVSKLLQFINNYEPGLEPWLETLSLQQVQDTRARFAEARQIAASRFRESFAQQDTLPPNERWRAHLEIQAASMLDVTKGVSLEAGLRIAYLLDEREGRVIYPVVIARDAPYPKVTDPERLTPTVSLFPFFRIEKTVEALFEYWIFTSELLSSAAWPMTRIISTYEEYNQTLAGMTQLQLVKALTVNFLPSGEFRDDGTAILEVVVYSRAGEERIERRELLLDRNQEFNFHSRDLIAEGRGGIRVDS